MEKKFQIRMSAQQLNFYYGDFHALHKITLDFYTNQVTALIGPSGCGKSTLLRCLNRMNDLIPYSRVEGKILLDDEDIYDPNVDVNLNRSDYKRTPVRPRFPESK